MGYLNETRFLSVEELAILLKISPGRIRNRLSQNEKMPKSIRIGRRRLFPVSEYEKWVAEFLHEPESVASSEGGQE